jgi:hypothetical protein
VWSADPAIRDFIGIAENQWDFTLSAAQGGPPGFGPMDPTHDVAKMVAEIFGEVRKVAEATPEAAAPPVSASDSKPVVTAQRGGDKKIFDVATAPMPDIAPQHETLQISANENDDADETPALPTHGGALPR